MYMELMMPSNHLILCYPLLLLPSISPSIRVFSNESALCIRWPKFWSFSISPFNEYSGLISLEIDWFDLLTVQETVKSLLQDHSLRASILRCSAFFMIQLSHPYVTTWKVMALTIRTFVCKVMSLLLKLLSRFDIAILPRSNRLLILRLQSLSALILEPKKMKSDTVSTFPPSICHEMMELDALILVFWMLRFFFPFIFISWRLITLQYCSGFCHTLTWISHRFTCEWWVLSQLLHSSLLPSSRGSLVPLHFLSLKWYNLHIWGCWYFPQQSWFQFVLHTAR